MRSENSRGKETIQAFSDAWFLWSKSSELLTVVPARGRYITETPALMVELQWAKRLNARCGNQGYKATPSNCSLRRGPVGHLRVRVVGGGRRPGNYMEKQNRKMSQPKIPDFAKLSIYQMYALCCCVLSCSVTSDSLGPHGLQPARLHQASLSTRLSRQEYWSGLTFLASRRSSQPRIKPLSSTLAGRFLTTEPPGNPI